MPKDNEVDEKAVAFAVVVDGEPDYANVHKWACESEAGVYGDGPIVTIEPLTYAATVAELRADRDSWREQAEDRLREWDKLRAEIECLRVELAGSQERALIVLRAKNEWMDRAAAAERRVGELEAAASTALGRLRYLNSLTGKKIDADIIDKIKAALTGADPT